MMGWRGLLSLAQHMGCDVGWQIVPSAILNPESPRLGAGAGDEAAKRQRGVRRVTQALDDDRRLQGQYRGTVYADDKWGICVHRGRLGHRGRRIESTVIRVAAIGLSVSDGSRRQDIFTERVAHSVLGKPLTAMAPAMTLGKREGYLAAEGRDVLAF